MPLWLSLALLPALSGCTGPQITFPDAMTGDGGMPPPSGKPEKRSRVILIDIDDHGLKALWDANAPTLKQMIAGGVFGFSKVTFVTHSNHNNYTIMTGNYNDGHLVPTNAWIDRQTWQASIDLGGSLKIGSYVYYDQNPLQFLESPYKVVSQAGLTSGFVGQLPIYEIGANHVELTLVGLGYGGFTLDKFGTLSLLQLIHYPQSVIDGYDLRGPEIDPATGKPTKSSNHFTIGEVGRIYRESTAQNPPPDFMFAWTFLALDGNPTGKYGADGPELARVVEDYDKAFSEILDGIKTAGLEEHTNVIITMDHGKVDSDKQVNLEVQLAAAVERRGDPSLTTDDYVVYNEDGDAFVYAKVPNAGTPEGQERQTEVRNALVEIIQSGELQGVDTRYTMTYEGYLGTKRLYDSHLTLATMGDIVVYPADGWTLNSVDKSQNVGPFDPSVHPRYYGRHGGMADDEIYVPIFLYGPAFKKGVMLPAPINHVDTIATALSTIGLPAPRTEQGGRIDAALKDNPGETIPLPSDMRQARDQILEAVGRQGAAPRLASAPADRAVLVDLGGVYHQDLITDDPQVSAATANLRALMAESAVFQNYFTRHRDLPINSYQLLTGSYPVRLTPVPFAEADPAVTVAPGYGQLKLPAPDNGIADPAGYDAWRKTEDFGQETIFDVGHRLGLATALVGELDTHDQHIALAAVDFVAKGDGQQAASSLAEILSRNGGKVLCVMALGNPQAQGTARIDELARIDAMIGTVRQAVGGAPGTLLVVASRGGAPIDSEMADAYGPQSARHGALLISGPNVRAGVVMSDPAQPVDVPVTLLYGLGLAGKPDLPHGLQLDGGTGMYGEQLPVPKQALGAAVLVRAFDVIR